MKIYGHPWSVHTRRVLMTVAEKGHDAELVLVNLPKGEHKQPEHMARHPFGKVPVLEDGFFLAESGAINRYLDKKLDGFKAQADQVRGVEVIESLLAGQRHRFILTIHVIDRSEASPACGRGKVLGPVSGCFGCGKDWKRSKSR